jgi:putative transposase
LPMQVFDPNQEYAVVDRRLPHWSQAGTICFITWRTWDSMPAYVIEGWMAERVAWLHRHGIDPSRPDWKRCLETLPSDRLREFQRYLSDRWNDQLDALHGACILRRPALSRIVADSLDHADRVDYNLTDYVVMPNHVHLLATFPDEEAMLAQCESWRHYTATEINHTLGRKGRFWQQDGFDHLVRSVEQFDHVRRYIAENPCRAHLKPGEYIHKSKDLACTPHAPREGGRTRTTL